jgi:hypothetical protein
MKNTYRILFSFAKTGGAVFLSHLNLVDIFAMASRRASLPVAFSEGFNPLPKFDFAAPLPLGIEAMADIGSCDLSLPGPVPLTCPSDLSLLRPVPTETCPYRDLSQPTPDTFKAALNSVLPDGIFIVEAAAFLIPEGKKKHSVASLLWGAAYDDGEGGDFIVESSAEKAYRQSRDRVYGLTRKCLFAKNPAANANALAPYAAYFDVYRGLYGG